MLDLMVGAILEAREQVAPPRAALVALSGIDASGKGHVAAQLAERLRQCGRKVAVLNADGWLNLPQHRFDPFRPAAHFYEHALRLDEMFERLVEPLRSRGAVHLTADHADETATVFRPERYDLEGIEVVLLEGIFLLKREHQGRYDLSIWVDCSEATALERAVARGQEGLSEAATAASYRRIYFPAQAIHEERDDPHAAADLVYTNDPRLGPPGRVTLGLAAGGDISRIPAFLTAS
ncbi:MAG TPA: uridine kinase [Candidatus Polarisedimenticolia bacterium]|nr:uridine kinase [Candidatus Polarisedimenticolia bacterium]